MTNRITTVLALLCAAACVLLMPRPAAAQDEGATYYTYVSEWTVPRSDWAAFAKQDQATVASMKKAVSDGLLVAFGTAEMRIHSVDGYTNVEWFTAASRENLLKVLEDQWSGATNSSYVAATRHQDLFLHTMGHGGKSGASGSGYLRVAFYEPKPGEMGSFGSLMMTKIKPFLDSEVSKGNLVLYNIDAEEIHSQEGSGIDLAMLFPDGAAMDNFYSDYDAAIKSDPTATQLSTSLQEEKGHFDTLWRVTAFQNK